MIKKVLISLVALFVLSGCVATNSNNEVVGLKGVFTGKVYKPEILTSVYKVIVKGVTRYMTAEQIQIAQLDKVDAVIKYAYSVTVEGKKIDETAKSDSISSQYF